MKSGKYKFSSCAKKIWNLYTQIQDWGTTIELFLLCSRAWRREQGEESQEGARDLPSLEPSRPATPIQSLCLPCPRTSPGPPPRRRWPASSWSMEPSVRLHTFGSPACRRDSSLMEPRDVSRSPLAALPRACGSRSPVEPRPRRSRAPARSRLGLAGVVTLEIGSGWDVGWLAGWLGVESQSTPRV